MSTDNTTSAPILPEGLAELIAAADQTATSSSVNSYARWDDDREIGAYAALPGASIHRDSDALDRSNAECIREHVRTQWPDALVIEGASHWAVGWVEAAMVPVYTDTGEIHPAALFAIEASRALADYPIWDEMHFSELEHTEMTEHLLSYGRDYLTRGVYETDDAPDDWALQVIGAMQNVSCLEDIRDEDFTRVAIELGYAAEDED